MVLKKTDAEFRVADMLFKLLLAEKAKGLMRALQAPHNHRHCLCDVSTTSMKAFSIRL
jgi:hypothetical protein